VNCVLTLTLTLTLALTLRLTPNLALTLQLTLTLIYRTLSKKLIYMYIFMEDNEYPITITLLNFHRGYNLWMVLGSDCGNLLLKCCKNS